MQTRSFSVNFTYETLVESYLQVTDEEKYAYCDVEALGNLMMGVGENTLNYETRLKVTFLSITDLYLLENLKIASITFLVVSSLASTLIL